VAGLLCPDPLGELMRSTGRLAVMGAYLTGERGGKGPTSKEGGREGREERGDGNEEEGNPPKVKVSRRNAVGELEKRL